jgi:hypothetical protein
MIRRSDARRAQRLSVGLAAGALLALAVAVPASAHPHYAAPGQDGAGQVLANGQNHPRFLANGDGTFSSCVAYGPIPGQSIGNAWYGLETAHHGPDSGAPGKSDGCFVADGNPALGQDDQNPAIR